MKQNSSFAFFRLSVLDSSTHRIALYSTIGTGIFIYLWAMIAKCLLKKEKKEEK